MKRVEPRIIAERLDCSRPRSLCFTPAGSSPGDQLVQSRAAEAFQVMLPIFLPLDGHLVGDPGQRNIWLGAAKLLQGCPGDVVLSGHARGGGHDPVSTYK